MMTSTTAIVALSTRRAIPERQVLKESEGSRDLLPIVTCTELAPRGLQVTAQSLQSSTHGMMQSPLLGKGLGGGQQGPPQGPVASC
jgi:hypothetical protein